MHYLLDTHIFLWSLRDPEKLSSKALAVLESTENIVYVSAAVSWEIFVKRAKGTLAFTGDVSDILDQQSFEPLPISHQHTTALEKLPTIRHDPFDRIMIAQAIIEDLTFITRDRMILKYEDVKLLKG
ncbi:type II toxin-antitoxin system VapC family toxin [Tunicatimonas pelagia]|uniref:type II toxin-antitoxin system VapC family toxin n=1 Tax=Tunicatimonas pelagia TaxID=931531 RepID=UPI0026659AE8|nr:type II toxin-antitoxin system VapC family toxin [Tunicatimonas pelagia]WKN45052.1 type II toxin-antitoxin system VapC family toxin [Tunicatimonas pelagia]